MHTLISTTAEPTATVFLQRRTRHLKLLSGITPRCQGLTFSMTISEQPALEVDGLIWHEFISEDPIKEVTWAQQLAAASEVPIALVGLVDFRDPDLPERLDIYRSLSNLTAVRQHLGWDNHNPLRRFAPRADLMADAKWLKGLAR